VGKPIVSGKAFKSTASWGARLMTDPLRMSLGGTVDEERGTVAEALRRGADMIQLNRLLFQLSRQSVDTYSVWRSDDSVGLQASGTAFTLQMDPGLLQQSQSRLLSTEFDAYRRRVNAEFEALPEDVQSAFGEGSGKKAPKDPAERLKFQAHERALHREYYHKMRPIYYNAGYSDPANQFLKDIKPATLLGKNVAGGLHPKYIDALNGLAGLLNSWKPGSADEIGRQLHDLGGFVPRYIAGTSVMSNHAFGLAVDIDPAWNPHVKDPTVIAVIKDVTGYDFGEPIVAMESGIPDVDRVAQINARVQDASDRFRNWLRRALDVYNSRSSVDKYTEIDNARIQRLLRVVKMPDLVEWSKHGVQTIPLLLAAAMAKLGFRWGADYQHSKDVMHFELLVGKEIPPDSPPRTFEQLLPGGGGTSLMASRRRTN